MRMVDGMLNENKDIIFSIIVDLVSRDIISSSIRFDQLNLDNIFSEINKHFIQNIFSHEEKLKIKDIQKPEESFGVRHIYVSNMDYQRRAILDINLKHGRIPSFNDVLFCNKSITIQQIHLFVMRAVSYTSTSFNQLSKKRAFILSNFELLRPQVRHYAKDLAFKKQTSSENRFNLYIISLNPSKSQQIALPAETAKLIGPRIGKRYLFLSERPCLGKTTRIDHEAAKQHFKLKRVIINGFPNGEAMIRQHKRFMRQYVQVLGQHQNGGGLMTSRNDTEEEENKRPSGT